MARILPRRSLVTGFALVILCGAPAARALPLQISTTSVANGTAGTAYSDAVVAVNGTTPYVWTLGSGALPAGVSLDSGTGALSGTPTTAGTSAFIVAVGDALGDTATVALSITIAPGAAATLAFLVQPSGALEGATIVPAVEVKVSDAFGNGVPGESVSLSLVGTGTLSGGGAVVSNASGIAAFGALSVDVSGSKQLTAASGSLPDATSDPFTIQCGLVTLSPPSLPDAQLGAPYSQTLSATGSLAPYAFAVVSGALPAGLTLGSAGGLSGTPTSSGVFSFGVSAASASGCAGVAPYTLTVPGVPAAITNLAAAPVTSGNGASGREAIRLTFTPSAFASTFEVYRAPFGGYPRYDDAGGLVPATPSYPPGAPWTLTAVSASGQSDLPATRDAWHYVVFQKNEFGQVSAVSNKTGGTPDYALGDVSDGFVAGSGDNLVNDLDISLLGAHYGISGAALQTNGVSFLDVGPTVDFTVDSRPFTDQRVDFEDLIVMATNYGTVSGPAALIAAADARARAASGAERFTLDAPERVGPGATFTATVHLEGAGRVQGLSVELGWDASVAEPVAFASTGWVESLHGIVLSGRAGTVDAALLGARERGLTGSADLATVTFRALRAGDPAIRFVRVTARDAANRAIPDAWLETGAREGAPARTLLFAPWPNPARGDATVSFALAASGPVELAVFSVDGRRVRTLAHGTFAAGTHRLTWSGDDDAHRAVAPGLYYAQLVVQGHRFSQKLVHFE